MKEEFDPVRLNTKPAISYTFRNAKKQKINLTPFVTVTLYVKQEGVLVDTAIGEFATDRLSGVVSSTYKFASPGIWDIQFQAIDASSNELWGEPLQIRVAKNVPNLALADLAQE